MSCELYIYSASGVVPESDEVADLLELGGWCLALVSSIETLSPKSISDSPTAIGWTVDCPAATAIEDSVMTHSVDTIRQIEEVSLVEITTDCDFDSDPEAIAEMVADGLDATLVSRVEKAATRFGFRVSGRGDDQDFEFQLALAAAVGVLVDGVLEDLEEGTLEDCSVEACED